MCLLKNITLIVEDAFKNKNPNYGEEISKEAAKKYTQSKYEIMHYSSLNPVGRINFFEWGVIEKWIEIENEKDGSLKGDRDTDIAKLCLIMQDVMHTLSSSKNESIAFFDMMTSMLSMTYYESINNDVNRISNETIGSYYLENREFITSNKLITLMFFDKIESKALELLNK